MLGHRLHIADKVSHHLHRKRFAELASSKAILMDTYRYKLFKKPEGALGKKFLSARVVECVKMIVLLQWIQIQNFDSCYNSFTAFYQGIRGNC